MDLSQSKSKPKGTVGDVLLKQSRGRGLSTSRNTSGSVGSVDLDLQAIEDGWEVMGRFLNSIRNISAEINPEDAANKVIEETCSLLKCDRSTLFFVDADAGELILVVAKGAENIHIPIGSGIAGSVAATGNTANIPDAYEDERFDSTFDSQSGFRTKSVLATTVREPDGTVVAVLQCINKNDGDCFTKSDEVLLEHMASHVGVVLRNAKLYESERSSKQKISSLLEVIRTVHNTTTSTSGNSTNSLIFTLSNRSHELVDADRCTLYLVDRPAKQLVVMQGDVDFRFPFDKGLVGACVVDEKPVVINDAYADDRFSQDMDKKTGYRTKSILCMPIFSPSSVLPEAHRVEGAHGQLIGVLQVINKLDDEEAFTPEDCDMLETLLTVAGPLLGRSKFFLRQPKGSVVDMAVGNLAPPSPATGHKHSSSMCAFNEDEEEEG